jgi:penicillin amidase
MRVLGWILAGVLGLAIAAAMVVVAGLWLALPQTRGEIRLAGLAAPVAVTRDMRGILYIRAGSEADAAFALGFVHAQDRFPQMEVMRRLAGGRLAEIVGERGLNNDRFMRTLGLGRLAENSVAQLSPEAREVLEAYARGVNAWIDAYRVPPPELLIFGRKPEPWRPADSLLWGRIMALQLTFGWRDEMIRAAVAAKLGPEQAADLLGRAEPPVPVAALPGDGLPGDLAMRLLAAIPEEAKPRSASNIWLLSGSRTESGKPLLANDPHLALTLPNVWYLARIETPEALRVGATAPGVPFTVLGHNGRIAWGFTTTQSDTSDLIVLEDAGGDSYRTATGTERIATRRETLFVKGGPAAELIVRETPLGPVISDVTPGAARLGKAVALSSTALQADDRTPDALLRLNRAAGVEAAQAVLARDFHTPMQNVGVADADHIGLFVAGRVPRRNRSGAFAVASTDANAAWSGWLELAPALSVVDPLSGRLVSANNAPFAGGDPGFGGEYDAPYRARRIVERLDATQAATPRDMAAMQADSVSTMARDLLPVLLKLTPREPANAWALDRLVHWDGTFGRDRSEPLIFTAWWRRLLEALYKDDLGELWGEVLPRPATVARALTERTHWCDDRGTPEVETCPQRLSASLNAALSDLSARYGRNPDKWRWGEAHRARLVHPLLGRLPVIGALFRIEPMADGDNWTVNRAQTRLLDDADPFGDVHGAGYRAVYDLADLDSSLFQMSLGQSGHRLSPHFADLARSWAEGFPFRLGKEPERPRGTLTLAPR